MVRRFAIPLVGIALTTSWVGVLAGIYAAGPSFSLTTAMRADRLHVAGLQADTPVHVASLAQTGPLAVKSERHVAAAGEARPSAAARFDAVVAAAKLSPSRLKAAFAAAGMEPPAPSVAPDSTQTLASMMHPAIDGSAPGAMRFGPDAGEYPTSYIVALAIPSPEEAIAEELGPLAALEPDSLGLPAIEDIPLPVRRPAIVQRQSEKPRVAAIERDKPVAAGREKPVMRQQRQSLREFAYAPPDDGAGSVRGAFKTLFNTATAGNGVAVYDISAATVTMPDGQVLEAHSGIGESADNPKHVHKKMRGPTPPDTYNLVMRERRFHGVEAIRLIPADGKTKLNRTGLLAHSYLLRGGRAESHGCVAFKDYDKFLNAFKKGKVKRLIVVS